MECQAAEETQVVFEWFASVVVAIQGSQSMVFGNVRWQVASSTDGVIANLGNEPGHIRDEIHDPFAIRPLLPYPPK